MDGQELGEAQRSRARGHRLQGYLADKKQPTPALDLHRALGIVLRQGPRGALFLMSEVTLQVEYQRFVPQGF